MSSPTGMYFPSCFPTYTLFSTKICLFSEVCSQLPVRPLKCVYTIVASCTAMQETSQKKSIRGCRGHL